MRNFWRSLTRHVPLPSSTRDERYISRTPPNPEISLSRSTRKARKIQATPRHGSSAPAAASWRRRAPARGVPCIAGDAVVDVGVNWGSQLSHPLLPSSVVKMLKANSISKVKLFDADHWPVDALVDSSIEVMLRILRRVPTGHQRPHD
jgi:hypothetical protein